MAGKMWFGTRGYMQHVPMPAFNADFSKQGFSTSTQYLNGGASVRNSTSSHKVYNLAWNLTRRDELRPIVDYADGVFGDGLIYFIDPMASDKNVLPQHWAFPAQAAKDAPILFNDSRPATVTTSSNGLGYPSKSMQYALEEDSAKVFLPIPPGVVAWVGVHGSADGWGGVRVTPFDRQDSAGDAEYPTILSVNDPVRVNSSFSGAVWGGIELSLGVGVGTFGGLYPALDLYPSLNVFPLDGAPPATSVILSGLMVQMLPIGKAPGVGGFISGQGHSGCQFENQPQQTAYSAGLDLAGLSAKLVETGAWL